MIYIVLLLSSILVIITEMNLFSIFYKKILNERFFSYQTTLNKNVLNDKIIIKVDDQTKYLEYNVKGDKKIKHLPGNIYIKDDYNIFITVNNSQFLLVKDVIYKLLSDFTLEIIDVTISGEFKYYYIHS